MDRFDFASFGCQTQRGRVILTNSDRLFFTLLYRWFPSILNVMRIVQPDTLVRWHRDGFRRYWRWKSRNLGGPPPLDPELRTLIRGISLENALWGAPRIQGRRRVRICAEDISGNERIARS